MTYEIVNCSPKATVKIASFDDAKGIDAKPQHRRAKYPFDLLHIGQAFAVPINEVQETSLRVAAHGHGKKRDKKFAVIKHQTLGCFEVARIA